MDDGSQEDVYEVGEDVYRELDESEYDFGTFRGLDSDDEADVGRPVEDHTLDPFTAAQQLEREQAASLGEDGGGDEHDDDAVNFTQRLLTNAQTLKQLRASGEPAVRVEYDRDDGAQVPIVKDIEQEQPQLSQSFSDYRPTPGSQARSQSTPKLNRSRSGRDAQRDGRRRYAGADRQIYDSLKRLGDDEDVVGRFETFPAGALRDLPYHVFALVLERSRRYVIDRSALAYDRPQAACLSTLALARDLHGDTVFQVVDRFEHSYILRDLHLDHTPACEVLASAVEGAGMGYTNTATGLRLLDFHFDYAGHVEAAEGQRGEAGMPDDSSESLGRALHSSTPELLRRLGDPEPEAASATGAARLTGQSGSQATIVDPTSEAVVPRLIIVQAETVDWDRFQLAVITDADRRRQAAKMYEREESNAGQAGRAGAGAGAQAGVQDDLEDFPIEMED